MQQTIDINLLKKDPDFFFSKLPKKAESEINEFLRFIFFKYDINIDTEKFELENNNAENLLNSFASLRTGLPSNYKFNREEANER